MNIDDIVISLAIPCIAWWMALKEDPEEANPILQSCLFIAYVAFFTVW